MNGKRIENLAIKLTAEIFTGMKKGYRTFIFT